MKKFMPGLLLVGSLFASVFGTPAASMTAKAPAAHTLIVDGGPPGPCILCRGTGG